jgi:hypothetical protein
MNCRKRALSLLLLALSPLLLDSQECSEVSKKSSAEALISYLRSASQLSATDRNAACITLAIQSLSFKPSKEATDVLISFLSFRRPLTKPEKSGIFSRAPDIGTYFPATTTLFTFGPSIAPRLIDVVKASERPNVRTNAAFTLALIYREQPEFAIALMEEAAKDASVTEAQNLRSAAKDTVRYCAPRKRAHCEAAAKF